MPIDKLPLKKSYVNKILIGLIFASFSLMLVAFIALKDSEKKAEINEKIYQHPFFVSNAVLEANWHIASIHHVMSKIIEAKSAEELNNAIEIVEPHEAAVKEQFSLINARYLGDKSDIADAQKVFAKWQRIRLDIIAFKRSQTRLKVSTQLARDNEGHFVLLNEKMQIVINFARQKAYDLNESSQINYKHNKSNFYLFIVIAMLSCGVTAVFVFFLINRQQKIQKASEDRYEALFNNAEVSIWSEDISDVVIELEKLRNTGVVDLRSYLNKNMHLTWALADKVKVNSINDATLALFEAQNQTEFIKQIQQTFGNDAIEVFINELCAIWNKDKTFISEANFKSLKGKKIQAIISFRIPKNPDDFNNIPITIIDITEHKKLIRKLKLSSRVFSDTNEGIIITDANCLILDVNPAFLKVTEYSADDVIGRSPKMLSSGKHSPDFYRDMWDKINIKGSWQGEIWNRKKTGEVFAEFLNISSLKDSNNNIINYIGMFTDITQTKRQQESIHQMAHYDALTGLSNRRLLLDRFNLALAQTKRSKTLLAVCFLDLDDFKPVNDTFGHEVGDKLLIEVAHRLEMAVRTEDTVSRLGGDEFAMLLGNVQSTEQCHELLDRILQSISASYYIEDNAIHIGASIGVSIAPSDGIELDPLLRQADQAMYLAKQEGKHNFQFFDLKREQAATLRNVKLQDMRNALANNELCLYYQPKVNMAEGVITGVEALIRWNHPTRGLLAPIEFLPLIEGTVLEVEVGNLVIEQALTQLGLLNTHDINIEMSVNVSSLQLSDDNFFDGLKAALNRHKNIDASYFNLEILESSNLGDLERITTIIKTCREELGVSIALDDFGTGYSSLSHLSQLPADMIKIDQSFIRNLLLDPDDFAIIDGVIGLTRSFSRNVIAEGVETEEDGIMLLLMGCNHGQGYAISKPMKAEDLIGWINAYKPNQRWLQSNSDELNLQVIRVKQLELIFKYWFRKITCVKKWKPDELIDVAHMDYYIGKWIKRLREDQLFESQWIEELLIAYAELLKYANEFIAHKKKKNIFSMQASLDKLEKSFDTTCSILASVSLK